MSFLFYAHIAHSQTPSCTDLRAQVVSECDIATLNIAEIQQRFDDIKSNVESEDPEQGIAAANTKSRDSIKQSATDLQTYSVRCLSKVIECSTGWGQTIPATIPAGFTYACMENPAADNYNSVQNLGRDMCQLLDQQEALLGTISAQEDNSLCATFTDQTVAATPPAAATPTAAPAPSLDTSTTSVATEESDTPDDEAEEASPTGTGEPGESSAGFASLEESLRSPASVLGLGVSYGDSLIGVANADIFLQMDQRAQQLMSEMEN